MAVFFDPRWTQVLDLLKKQSGPTCVDCIKDGIQANRVDVVRLVCEKLLNGDHVNKDNKGTCVDCLKSNKAVYWPPRNK